MKQKRSTIINYKIDLPSGYGSLIISYFDRKLIRIKLFSKRTKLKQARRISKLRDIRFEKRLKKDFENYFCGKNVKFNYKLDLTKYTDFQKAVWKTLRKTPFGQTRSYGWIAKKIGKPKAARAVGNACAANPFPIIQPCHRVIASDGSLGGFSAGLDLKIKLLKLEKAII